MIFPTILLASTAFISGSLGVSAAVDDEGQASCLSTSTAASCMPVPASSLLQVQREKNKKGYVEGKDAPVEISALSSTGKETLLYGIAAQQSLSSVGSSVLAQDAVKAMHTQALVHARKRKAQQEKPVALANLKDEEIQEKAIQKQRLDCPLPENATWCQVRLDGLTPYMMAVRSSIDVVSGSICENGFWEVADFGSYGPPGKAMDIGGNMGYFTFALAHAGWNLTTFEPMKNNLDLMNATICANPQFAEKVDIHPFGLGTQNQVCGFVFHKTNVGNGITRCNDDKNMWWENIERDFVRGGAEYQLRRFDEVLNELQTEGKLQAVDFVKIDVEGYECEVLKGAPDFLAKFAPRLVKTEVWPHLERCEPGEYLTKYLDAGYQMARDAACTEIEADVEHAGGDFYACKK